MMEPPNEFDDLLEEERKQLEEWMTTFQVLMKVVDDKSIVDIRSAVFEQISREELEAQLEAVKVWLENNNEWG